VGRFVRRKSEHSYVRLTNLELTNYRAFMHVRLEVPSHGLILVAGQNNAGKSALLSVFDILAGRDPGLPAKHHGAAGPATITARFKLDPAEREAAFSHSDHGDEWLTSPVLTHVEWTLVQDPDHRFVWRSIATEDQAGEMERFGETTGSPPGSTSVVDLYSAFTNVRANVQPQWGGVPRTNQSGGDHHLVLRSNARAVAEPLARWSDNVFHFNAIRTGTPRLTAIQNVVPALQADGGNLAECLLYQFSQDSPEWHAITQVMTDVLPDVGDLVVPVEGSSIAIAFVDLTSLERRNLKDLGSGVEQLLMTAYVGETQPPRSVALIEEPETSLHPAAQRELLRHLLRFAEDRLVVATTHSPVFLDGTANLGRTLLVRRDVGRSQLVETGENLTEAMNEIGVRLSDVLSAERVLLVEGESDADVLRAWFPQLLLRRRVATVALGGSDAGYHLENIVEVLNGADELGRQLLFVRDRDELGPRRLATLEANPRIAVLARREIENYFLDDEAAIAAVLADRRLEAGGAAADGTLEPDAIRLALKQAADLLVPVVVLKRLVEDHVPARLLGRAEVQRLAAGTPSSATLRATLDDAMGKAVSAVAGLEERWTAIERDLHDRWDADWTYLAPGSDVLAAVWQEHGLRYDKAKDGLRVATAMTTAPDELRNIVERFAA
jgi:ABC-type Mn2+/Zn2+ transport system ATPase subunit